MAGIAAPPRSEQRPLFPQLDDDQRRPLRQQYTGCALRVAQCGDGHPGVDGSLGKVRREQRSVRPERRRHRAFRAGVHVERDAVLPGEPRRRQQRLFRRFQIQVDGVEAGQEGSQPFLDGSSG